MITGHGGRMILWLTRLPTIAEVRAHSAAHPAQGPGWTTPGVWGYWLLQDGDPRLVLLRADDEGVWLPDGDMLTERRCPGAKWLPCTANGIPVCFVWQEKERIAGWEQASAWQRLVSQISLAAGAIDLTGDDLVKYIAELRAAADREAQQ